jgi:hypothetical protein
MEGIPLQQQNRNRIIFFETYRGTSLIRKSNKFKTKVFPIRYGILRGNRKCIINRKSHKTEWYDLGKDWFELDNLKEKENAGFKNLNTLLDKKIVHIINFIHKTRKYYSRSSKLTQEDIEKLKSLGYIQ